MNIMELRMSLIMKMFKTPGTKSFPTWLPWTTI